MTQDNLSRPTSIVIFGATGDLAKRKLFPAFFNLFLDGRMPHKFQLLALGKEACRPDEFWNYVRKNIAEFSRDRKFTNQQWLDFSTRITFLHFDFAQEGSFHILQDKLLALEHAFGASSNRLFYLSVAPRFIGLISSHLSRLGLVDNLTDHRIVIEKPFGHDKASAMALNNLLNQYFKEEQIYRIDHYLGKDTVQNILAFRFGNTIFEPLWNKQYIDSIQISVAEQVGVEERGDYYDRSGALRDMIQNHLLQILCLVAMEAPADFDPALISDSKVALLRAVRRIKAADMNHHSVRAQYNNGEINGKEKIGYKKELGVNSLSNTETFVALKFYIDNERWEGIPFYLRTGKAMQQKQAAVVVNFKQVTPGTFANSNSLIPNQLTITIQPEMDIRLSFMTKKPGLDMTLKPAEMIFDYLDCAAEGENAEAYETLLLDALAGEATRFMRADEVEEAWDIMATIQEVWAKGNDVPMHLYAAGSSGPQAADDLLARQGHHWPSNGLNTTDKKKSVATLSS